MLSSPATHALGIPALPAPSRPLSPHLQIYRPQLTSVLSVLHRASGIILALGALLIAAWLAAVAMGPGAYQTAHAMLNSWAGCALLIAWTLCTFYHLCNGIRHLAWDAGFGFELPAAYSSGKAVVAAAVALTVIAWAIA